MLKHDITYTNFDDEEITETFYFNVSEPELIQLDVEIPGGWAARITRANDAKDNNVLFQEFKKLLLLAYGEKSDDGKHFIKSEEISKRFSQSAAYLQLFEDITTKDDFAATFVIQVMPKKFRGQLEAAEKEITGSAGGPPPVPPAR